MERMPIESRFWNKIASTATGCWLWGAAIARNGYGRFAYDGNMREAHRYAYRLLVDDIPEGMEIDHTCAVRHCVNPQHLQLVSRGFNAKQGGQRRRERERAKPACKNEHPWTAETTKIQHGSRRRCGICQTENFKAYHLSRKEG